MADAGKRGKKRVAEKVEEEVEEEKPTKKLKTDTKKQAPAKEEEPDEGPKTKKGQKVKIDVPSKIEWDVTHFHSKEVGVKASKALPESLDIFKQAVDQFLIKNNTNPAKLSNAATLLQTISNFQ